MAVEESGKVREVFVTEKEVHSIFEDGKLLFLIALVMSDAMDDADVLKLIGVR